VTFKKTARIAPPTRGRRRIVVSVRRTFCFPFSQQVRPVSKAVFGFYGVMRGMEASVSIHAFAQRPQRTAAASK
jgi:hypothetical protein